MICKNCGSSLRSDFGYCPNCGAKVIRNRLTMKNIWQDLSFQVFNLDNTFLKTFRHLFKRPEEVIESYISGVRKRYMNPISYFAIAITLSGVLFFVLRNVYDVSLTKNSLSDTNAPDLDFIFDYQGLMSYLIMPIYALLTWLLFLDKNKLNYTEHLVANSYTTAQASFVQLLVALPLFGIFDIAYDIFNWAYLVFIVAYQFFVFGRIHQTPLINTIIRGLGYLILMLLTTFLIGIGIFAMMLVLGKINLEDFAPKP